MLKEIGQKKMFLRSMIIGIITALLIVQPLFSKTLQAESKHTLKLNNKIERFSGQDRFKTMAQIALKLYPEKVSTVILAYGYNFPDALAGVPLAYQKKAPILLVGDSPAASTDALSYIKSHLDPQGSIYLLGGEQVVGREFIASLQEIGFNLEQIKSLGGATRYDTALAIAANLDHDGTEFYVVTGDTYPDALSASVIAAKRGIPIILVPAQGPLPEAIVQYFNTLALSKDQNPPQTFHIVGGPGAIPEEIVKELLTKVKRATSDSFKRHEGEDRYATMKALMEKEEFVNASRQDKTITPIPQIFLATGNNYPDALTGAVLAAKADAPLVLINEQIPEATATLLLDYYNRNLTGISNGAAISVLGGAEVISEQTAIAADYLLNYGKSPKGQPQVTTFAGSGLLGYKDGKVYEAAFSFPSAAVQGKDGTVYISDTRNHRIRAISPDGKVSTYAGMSSEKDSYGMPRGGYQDGPKAQAMFNQPKGLALDSKGNLYVADSENGAVRVIDSDGMVKTLIKDLKLPSAVVIDESGNLYVSETLNHRILKVLPSGEFSILAGGGYQEDQGWLNGGYADGKGLTAQFNEPAGLALAKDGSLLVADTGNQRIRKVSSQGEVTTIAGTGFDRIENTTYVLGGFKDGSNVQAQFNFPSAIAIGPDGTLYVADTYNHSVRTIRTDGTVGTLTGSGQHGKQNGFLEQALFDGPTGVSITQDGNLLVVDQLNHLLRKIGLTK